MRIVHLVSTLNIGGLERVVFDLTRRVDGDRFRTRVLCLGEVGQLGPEFAAAGIDVEGLGVLRKGVFQSVRRVAKRLRALKPDVLHTHNPAPHLVGAIAAAIVGIPRVVHTKHGRNYPDVRSKVLANRLASWLTDEVVAVSDDAGRVALEVERIPARKLRVIRNGIDVQRFRPAESQPATGPRAAHVARLIYPTKDQITLLQAVRIVADSEPAFVLDIVGDGPHRDELEALCDRLDLRSHVVFHGFRPDVSAVLSAAGLFVLSSVSEGLSLTLLEAMAAGLPTVATDVGGNREVVSNGETGFLVAPRSPPELAEAMLRLVRNPELRKNMGRKARRRVEETFNLDTAVAEYEAVYRRAREKVTEWVPLRHQPLD